MSSIKKTYYQNPSIDDGKTRVEYVINNDGKLKNFRLLNFGVNSYTPSAGQQDIYYPSFCGSYCLIDTITLYSDVDGEMISQVRNVADYMSYKMLSDSEQINRNINIE